VTGYVDLHSHMIPAVDDGVRRFDEAVDLLRETARRGTAVQFATPHVNERYPLDPERDARITERHAHLATAVRAFGLDLQLGYELSAQPWLLDVDPRRYRLGDLDAVLLELPLPLARRCDLDIVRACAEHIEAAGLRPVLAHPERCREIQQDPERLRPFAERGWPMQVNASSLFGREGDPPRRTGWWMIDNGLADLVSSDGHRANRPPFLDEAYRVVRERVGAERADRLLGGGSVASEDDLARAAA